MISISKTLDLARKDMIIFKYILIYLDMFSYIWTYCNIKIQIKSKKRKKAKKT